MRFRSILATNALSIAFLFLSIAGESCSGGGPMALDDEAGPETTAFTHVNLVPMTGDLVVPDQTVLIEDGRIAAVGPASLILPRPGTTVIDGSGAYLMPGLADMHMHTREAWLDGSWPVSPLLLYLANGITTIRDLGPAGRDLTYALRWRDAIASGELPGPTIYASGARIDGIPVANLQETVRWNHDQGFRLLKIYSYVSVDDFHSVMVAARSLSFYTVGHIPFPVGLERALSEGLDEIAHVEELDFEFLDFDRNADLTEEEWLPYVIERALQQEDISGGFDGPDFKANHGDRLSRVITAIRTSDVTVSTTLSVSSGLVQKLFSPSAFLARPETSFLPPAYLASFQAGTEKHQIQFRGIEDLGTYKYELEQTLLTELHEGGVTLVLGTDAGTGSMGIVPGFSIHDELEILVKNGLTPYEAILSGTATASRVMERTTGVDDFGTVVVGKRADLLLLNANPLTDVANIRSTRGVMAAGRWYPSRDLDQWLARHSLAARTSSPS